MLIKQPGCNARLYANKTRSLASTSDSPSVMECCGIPLLTQDCLKSEDLWLCGRQDGGGLLSDTGKGQVPPSPGGVAAA